MFENLGVSDARVRHVSVDTVGARETRTRTRSAADRLVIAECLIAEKNVVHCALAARGHPKGADEDIDDALACLDIAADNGGGALWREQ